MIRIREVVVFPELPRLALPNVERNTQVASSQELLPAFDPYFEAQLPKTMGVTFSEQEQW